MVIYCNKCGQENPDDSKYCSKCGTLIKDYDKDEVQTKEEKVEIKEKDNKSKSKTINYVAYGVIVICVLIILLVPTKTVYETKQESYTSYESYIIQEPYLKEETYTEREPYISNDCNIIYSNEIDFNSMWQKLHTSQSEWVEIGCMITNLEEYEVTYDYIIEARNQDDAIEDTLQRYGEITLSPKSSTSVGEVSYQFPLDVSSGYVADCIVTPNEIETCEETTRYRNVEKERSVTAYKDVTKQRPVTKYRDVEISKKVNWILGISLFWN